MIKFLYFIEFEESQYYAVFNISQDSERAGRKNSFKQDLTGLGMHTSTGCACWDLCEDESGRLVCVSWLKHEKRLKVSVLGGFLFSKHPSSSVKPEQLNSLWDRFNTDTLTGSRWICFSSDRLLKRWVGVLLLGRQLVQTGHFFRGKPSESGQFHLCPLPSFSPCLVSVKHTDSSSTVKKNGLL